MRTRVEKEETTMPVETIMSANTQQFDDDEIVDNFGAGPDDGVPLGLGGEKGKQAEPASSTLEADMVAAPAKPAKQTEPTKQEKPLPDDDAVPSDDDAASGEPKSVQTTASDAGKAEAEPQTPTEPASPEFPAVLLQMAGFASPQDAQKAGFKDPETLLAAIQWRGQALARPAQATPPAEVPKTPPAQPTTIPAETPPGGGATTFKPFKPANAEAFDEELLKLLDEQHKHYAAQFEQQQKQFDQLASRLTARDEEDRQREFARQAEQFDNAVQALGKDWEAEFGQGSGEAIFRRTDATSIAAGNARKDLFVAVNLLRRANAEQGGAPMTPDQELQWALMQRYPEKFKQHLRRESEAKAQSRRGVQASRPTARKVPLGTKDERLLSALQTKFPNVDFSHGDSEIAGDI